MLKNGPIDLKSDMVVDIHYTIESLKSQSRKTKLAPELRARKHQIFPKKRGKNSFINEQ